MIDTRSRTSVATQAGQRLLHPQAGEGAGVHRELCDTLIDTVCERGECDFVRDIAAPLPMAVIGDMLARRPPTRHAVESSDDLVCGLSFHMDPASDEAQAADRHIRHVHEFTTGATTTSGEPSPPMTCSPSW